MKKKLEKLLKDFVFGPPKRGEKLPREIDFTTVYPDRMPTRQEWMDKFKVSSMYVKYK